MKKQSVLLRKSSTLIDSTFYLDLLCVETLLRAVIHHRSGAIIALPYFKSTDRSRPTDGTGVTAHKGDYVL
jgi:hypothetical protein